MTNEDEALAEADELSEWLFYTIGTECSMFSEMEQDLVRTISLMLDRDKPEKGIAVTVALQFDARRQLFERLALAVFPGQKDEIKAASKWLNEAGLARNELVHSGWSFGFDLHPERGLGRVNFQPRPSKIKTMQELHGVTDQSGKLDKDYIIRLCNKRAIGWKALLDFVHQNYRSERLAKGMMHIRENWVGAIPPPKE